MKLADQRWLTTTADSQPRDGTPSPPMLNLRPSGASVGDVLGDPPGIGHDRQRGVDAGSGREWAAVHHEEVVDLVASAPAVQHGGFRVVAHARRAVLV